MLELNLEKPLVARIRVDGIVRHIEYENLPIICYDCGRVGHRKENCPFNPHVMENSGDTQSVRHPIIVPAADKGFGVLMQVTRRRRPGPKQPASGGDKARSPDLGQQNQTQKAFQKDKGANVSSPRAPNEYATSSGQNKKDLPGPPVKKATQSGVLQIQKNHGQAYRQTQKGADPSASSNSFSILNTVSEDGSTALQKKTGQDRARQGTTTVGKGKNVVIDHSEGSTSSRSHSQVARTKTDNNKRKDTDVTVNREDDPSMI